MRGIKIPRQDFVLKMPGGLMREGGRICGRLRYKYSCCEGDSGTTGVWCSGTTGVCGAVVPLVCVVQ